MAKIKASIKRTVARLDVSGQINLFSSIIKVEDTPEKPQGCAAFINPDPKNILLGVLRLDEHLNTVKKP